jgi:hypothetical protein
MIRNQHGRNALRPEKSATFPETTPLPCIIEGGGDDAPGLATRVGAGVAYDNNGRPVTSAKQLKRAPEGPTAPRHRKGHAYEIGSKGEVKKGRRPRPRKRKRGTYDVIPGPQRLGRPRITFADAVLAGRIPPAGARKPLSDHARALLADYMRRDAYRHAVEVRRMPAAMARKAFFGHVEDPRARQIVAGTSKAGGAHRWFVLEAEAAIRSGKIGRAYEVAPGPEADAFYMTLAGERGDIDGMKAAVLGGKLRPVFEGDALVSGYADPAAELVAYVVHRHIADLRKRGIKNVG